MRFTKTPLAGVVHIEIEPHHDVRGFFTRIRCDDEFSAQGLPTHFVQSSISRNLRRGTVRGMHVQLPPSREGKLVRCIRGSIYDVVVDIRPDSPTYLQHFGVELRSDVHNAIYIPPLLLHGFQTLADDTDVLYEMTDFHASDLAFGARWNDPAFGIGWPIRTDIVIVERDASYPDFDPDAFRKRWREPRSSG